MGLLRFGKRFRKHCRQALTAFPVLLTFFAFSASHAARVEFDYNQWAKTYFKSAVDERRTVGAVLVVADSNRAIYVEGFGHGDLEAREPIHPVVTYVPIGDIGNLFTYQQIQRLEQDKRLTLDAPVNTFLTRVQLDPVYADTTVRDLLQNRSGFTTSPRGSLVRRNVRFPAATQFVRHLKANTKVADTGIPQYSSYAAAVATIMVEDLTGEPVDQRLTRFFVDELEVEPFFNTLENELPKYIVQHYSISKHGERTRQDLHAAAPGFLAAKGVHLTPADLAKLSSRLLSDLKRPSSSDAASETIIDAASYQSRFYEGLSLAGYEAFGISGTVQTATTDLVLIPELDIAVFAMTSGTRKSPDFSMARDRRTVAAPLTAREITRDLIATLHDSNVTQTAETDSQSLNKFAGVYAGIAWPDNEREDFFNIDRQIASVNVKDGAQIVINDSGPFQYVNDTTFVDVNGTVATFHLSADGQVKALTFASHTVNKLSDPDLLVKFLAGFGLAALLGLALFAAPTWMGRSFKESIAKWVGALAATTMVATIALPAWQYYQGWPSAFTEHPFFSVWISTLWALAGFTALTIVICAVAWKGRYWAMDGQGFRRRSRYTLGTIGLSGVVFTYIQLGLLPIAF